MQITLVVKLTSYSYKKQLRFSLRNIFNPIGTSLSLSLQSETQLHDFIKGLKYKNPAQNHIIHHYSPLALSHPV